MQYNMAILNLIRKLTVPNLCLSFVLGSKTIEVPKSITFMLSIDDYLSRRRFSGFKSLCTIFLLWQYTTADSNYLIIIAASSSLNDLTLLIFSKSSPPSMYSVIR